MALGLTNRGSGTHNTGAVSFTLSPASNLAAGSLAVLAVSADNNSSGGATNDLGAVTDSIGNTWTRERVPIFDNGAAAAGVQMAFYSTRQNVGALQTGTVITVATPTSPVAKTWTLTEVTKAANAEVAVIGGADQAGATTASPSFASSVIAVGDAVLFAVGMEAGTTQTATADADATNGAWSTQQYAEIGSTTSGSAIASQGKVQTTTPSAQTYNPTLGISSDLLVSYVILHEQHTATASFAATGGGVVSSSRTTARNRASALAAGGGIVSALAKGGHTRSATLATGSGTAASGGIAGRLAAIVDTGGGSATVARTTGRVVAVGATGSGALSWADEVISIENHDGVLLATGGGSAAPTITSTRGAAPGATGGGVASLSTTGARAGGVAATGSGLASPSLIAGRAAAVTATGAGSASASVVAARLGAALLSGGGVFATLSAPAHAASIAISGGGAGSFAGSQLEAHSGHFAATGAGTAIGSVSTDRPAAFAAAAAGRSSVAHQADHAFGTAIAAGGRLVLDAMSARLRSLAAAGSGALQIGVAVDHSSGAAFNGGGIVIWSGGADLPLDLPGVSAQVRIAAAAPIGIHVRTRPGTVIVDGRAI